MKKLILALGLLSATSASAAVSVLFSDTIGAPQEVTITSGASFTVSLWLQSTEVTSGVDFLMEALGSANGQFVLTGRDTLGSAFPDVITDNSIALQPTIAMLDPQNDVSLGGLPSGPTNPAGTHLIATFTFKSGDTIPLGTYTLSTANLDITDMDLNSFPGLSNATYTVNVIPEPSATAFLGLALAAVLRQRKR